MSSGRGGFGGYGATSQEFSDDPNRPTAPYRDNPFARHGGYQSGGFRNFNELCDYISSNIFTINNNATSLERSLRQIGTPKDSSVLWDRLHSIEVETNKLINATATSFHKLNSLCTRAERQQKLQYERLKNEFQDSAKRYSTLQKKIADKVKSTAFSSAAKQPQLISWQDDTTNDQASLVEQEEKRQQQLGQMQAQDQLVDGDLALIAEREERILQLEGDILDINDIFRDLATMVHEQGEVIDTIEANVESAQQRVEDGNQQLVQAARYQRKYRKKMCCLIIVLTVIAGIVALIIYFSVKK